MQTCDNCPKNWDCTEPCAKVVAWQELETKDRIKNGHYQSKGVPLFTKSGEQYRKEKAIKGGKR